MTTTAPEATTERGAVAAATAAGASASAASAEKNGDPTTSKVPSLAPVPRVPSRRPSSYPTSLDNEYDALLGATMAPHPPLPPQQQQPMFHQGYTSTMPGYMTMMNNNPYSPRMGCSAYEDRGGPVSTTTTSNNANNNTPKAKKSSAGAATTTTTTATKTKTSTSSTSSSTPRRRRPRRCRRCVQAGAPNDQAESCPGAKGSFGQKACLYFTEDGHTKKKEKEKNDDDNNGRTAVVAVAGVAVAGVAVAGLTGGAASKRPPPPSSSTTMVTPTASTTTTTSTSTTTTAKVAGTVGAESVTSAAMKSTTNVSKAGRNDASKNDKELSVHEKTAPVKTTTAKATLATQDALKTTVQPPTVHGNDFDDPVSLPLSSSLAERTKLRRVSVTPRPQDWRFHDAYMNAEGTVNAKTTSSEQRLQQQQHHHHHHHHRRVSSLPTTSAVAKVKKNKKVKEKTMTGTTTARTVSNSSLHCKYPIGTVLAVELGPNRFKEGKIQRYTKKGFKAVLHFPCDINGSYDLSRMRHFVLSGTEPNANVVIVNSNTLQTASSSSSSSDDNQTTNLTNNPPNFFDRVAVLWGDKIVWKGSVTNMLHSMDHGPLVFVEYDEGDKCWSILREEEHFKVLGGNEKSTFAAAAVLQKPHTFSGNTAAAGDIMKHEGVDLAAVPNRKRKCSSTPQEQGLSLKKKQKKLRAKSVAISTAPTGVEAMKINGKSKIIAHDAHQVTKASRTSDNAKITVVATATALSTTPSLSDLCTTQEALTSQLHVANKLLALSEEWNISKSGNHPIQEYLAYWHSRMGSGYLRRAVAGAEECTADPGQQLGPSEWFLAEKMMTALEVGIPSSDLWTSTVQLSKAWGLKTESHFKTKIEQIRMTGTAHCKNANGSGAQMNCTVASVSTSTIDTPVVATPAVAAATKAVATSTTPTAASVSGVASVGHDTIKRNQEDKSSSKSNKRRRLLNCRRHPPGQGIKLPPDHPAYDKVHGSRK